MSATGVGKRVLLIEDDTTMLSMMSRILRDADFDVVEAMRFEQGLDMARQGGFDLVLTDIFMPGIGGIAGIQVLRDEVPDLPIIAISGGYADMTSAEALAAAEKIGVVAALAKPLRRGDLMAAIDKALNREAG